MKLEEPVFKDISHRPRVNMNPEETNTRFPDGNGLLSIIKCPEIEARDGEQWASNSDFELESQLVQQTLSQYRDQIKSPKIADKTQNIQRVRTHAQSIRTKDSSAVVLPARESGGQYWTKVEPSKSTTTGSQAANFPSQPEAKQALWEQMQESGSSSSTDSEKDHVEDTTRLNPSLPLPMKTGSWWKFGTARHVSHFSSIQAEAGLIVPFSDKLKFAVEAYVGSKVLWWPLKSISSRPKPSEDQVLWKCVSIFRAPDGTFFAHETTVLRRSLQSFCSLSFQSRGY